MPKLIRDLLPPRVRQVVYSVLAALYLLEGIFDVVPDGAQTKIVAALAVLGFTMAAGNTNTGAKP